MLPRPAPGPQLSQRGATRSPALAFTPKHPLTCHPLRPYDPRFIALYARCHMSWSRHAYRHALRRPHASFLDHVWIGEDLLASTFRRFVNCQRRHGCQVPGPLEARRRLAKRRSTALASAGASSPHPGFISLFGKDGSEHMQWNDSPSVLSDPEPLGKEGSL